MYGFPRVYPHEDIHEVEIEGPQVVGWWAPAVEGPRPKCGRASTADHCKQLILWSWSAALRVEQCTAEQFIAMRIVEAYSTIENVYWLLHPVHVVG